MSQHQELDSIQRGRHTCIAVFADVGLEFFSHVVVPVLLLLWRFEVLDGLGVDTLALHGFELFCWCCAKIMQQSVANAGLWPGNLPLL